MCQKNDFLLILIVLKSWIDASGGGMVFRAHRYGPDYPGLKGKKLKPQGQIAEDIKDAWKPNVNLEGATQKGVKNWKKIWK